MTVYMPVCAFLLVFLWDGKAELERRGISCMSQLSVGSVGLFSKQLYQLALPHTPRRMPFLPGVSAAYIPICNKFYRTGGRKVASRCVFRFKTSFEVETLSFQFYVLSFVFLLNLMLLLLNIIILKSELCSFHGWFIAAFHRV